MVLACVAWRFWLGELSNKGGRGQRNREEIGFYFSRGFAREFVVATPLLCPARQNRHATQATMVLEGVSISLSTHTYFLLRRLMLFIITTEWWEKVMSQSA